MATPQFTPGPSLYDTDFYQWTQAMANALRQGSWQDLDIDNLVEEIDSLGRSDKRALKNRLEVLFMHLLKWSYQPEHRSHSWQTTIVEQRLRIQDLLADSPSLKPYLKTEQGRCYANARKLAATETGLDIATFPQQCPFTLKAVLTEGFLPE
jgi:hypothetical protein